MLRFRLVLSLVLSLLIAVFVASSASASVAYIDNNEVWVSSDDGARKVRLSAGENDWREVAQSDQGFIVGTRKEAGKISQLASFTVWDPTGRIVHFGSLSGEFTGGLNVYPLSLDITPSGGNIVYGYSACNWNCSSAPKGIYLKVSADATTGVPTSLSGAEFPTLLGTRIVGTVGQTNPALQDPSSIGSNDFTPWIDFGLGNPAGVYYGLIPTRTDMAATGTIAATELRDGSFNTQKIALSKWPSAGSPSIIDDCVLSTSGQADQISVSQDGALMTWRDSRGIVLAGVPSFNGALDCALTRAPSVISASGRYPSYGPFNVPAGGAPTGQLPIVKIGSSVKLASALKSGFKITVTSPIAGKARVKLTIKPSKVGKRGKKEITLATGSATLAANKATKIKVKFSSAGKKLKKKLKGKKATLVVTVGAATTTKTVKLK